MNPWTCCKWRNDLDFHPARSGLRMRVDPAVPVVIHDHCIQFAAWLRTQYLFPIRVPVYIYAKESIKAADGDVVSALFFEPFSHNVEPYAKVAIGLVADCEDQLSMKNAICSILCSIAHELTHYFQWINRVHYDSEQKQERQAAYYGRKISGMYTASYVWTPTELQLLDWKTCDHLDADAYQMLQEIVASENSNCKKMVISILPQQQSGEAKNLLLQLSNDQDASVRAYAMDVMCVVSDSECLEQLQKAVKVEKDVYARYCAIRSCADLMFALTEDLDSVRSFFRDVFNKEQDLLCRLGCGYALYLGGQHDALDMILELMRLADDHLLGEIMIVLQDIANDHNLKTIQTALLALRKDEKSAVVRDVIDAFGEMWSNQLQS